MLPLDAARWDGLRGGFRVPYDPRPTLARLASGDAQAAWETLWAELHHQGDVGEASYAAVPHLVRIHVERGVADWNTHTLVATIELARQHPRNPALPDDLREGYQRALDVLLDLAVSELPGATDATRVQALLSTIALAKGLRPLGRLLVELAPDELEEMIREYRRA